MPGDDLLPHATLQTTRAVTVHAPAAAVWPWLVQMGPRPRASAYTYDWIERMLGIDIATSERILPEFQQLASGEYLGLKNGQGLVASEVESDRHLVLQWVPTGNTWAFALYSEPDGATRLVSRNRLAGGGLRF